jgi:hypothetical protein
MRPTLADQSFGSQGFVIVSSIERSGSVASPSLDHVSIPALTKAETQTKKKPAPMQA